MLFVNASPPSPVGVKNAYYGCRECVLQRGRLLGSRNSLMSSTSSFFFAAGAVICSGRLVAVEAGVFQLYTTAAACGFLCGTLASQLVGWCYEHCYLRDRHCQHVDTASIINDIVRRNAQAPQPVARCMTSTLGARDFPTGPSE